MMLGYIKDSQIFFIDSVFSFYFLIEDLLNASVNGIKFITNDGLNLFSTIMNMLFLLEILIVEGKYDEEKINNTRFLRAIRALRVLSLLKSFTFTKLIMKNIAKSFESFSHLVALILIYNIIYAIIGIKIFKNQFKMHTEIYLFFNFDTFLSGFISVFYLIMMGDWTTLLHEGCESYHGPIKTNIFIVIGMFVGNFILMNLFQAILMDKLSEGFKYTKNKFIEDDSYNGKKKERTTDIEEFPDSGDARKSKL